jgi:hypothetical protein
MSITDLNNALEAATGLDISNADLKQRSDLLLIAAMLGISSDGGATAVTNNVASSTSSVQLLAANPNRKSAVIANDSTSILYLLYTNGNAASTTRYTYSLPAIASGVASTFTLQRKEWDGEIVGIWASANGFARVTEIT